jgi:hypothetical protein
LINLAFIRYIYMYKNSYKTQKNAHPYQGMSV